MARGPGSTYLASFDLDARHLELLYCLVRLLRPERVVETGVANGASSYVILRALAAQGSGRLDSFDVSSDVGRLVDDSLRDRWSLHALPAGGRARALRAQIQSLGTSDLFLHDSEHTYRWQSMEYDLGWRHLRSGGVLASDDVDASYAFLDFCEAHNLAPWIAVSARKVFGYVVKP